MKNFFRYLAGRLREPSTLAGLSAVGLLVGLPPGAIELGAQIFIGVAGIAAAVLPDSL